MVAVFVRSDREDACNDYVLDVLAEYFISLYLRAGIGHSVTIIFYVNVGNVNEIRQPIL
jgi:hypothetical protein